MSRKILRLEARQEELQTSRAYERRIHHIKQRHSAYRGLLFRYGIVGLAVTGISALGYVLHERMLRNEPWED